MHMTVVFLSLADIPDEAVSFDALQPPE